MNKVQAGRMFSLADFLESEVDECHFNIQVFVRGNLETLSLSGEHGCGSTACVAGYMPIAFPDYWSYSYGFPHLKGEKPGRWSEDFTDFFGITRLETLDITMPYSYSDNPTPADAARRIRSVAHRKGWEEA